MYQLNLNVHHSTTSSLAWCWAAIFIIEALAWTPFPLLHPHIPKTCLHMLQKIIWQVLFYWLTGSTIEASCQCGLGPFLQESLQNNTWSCCRTLHDQICCRPGTSCWHWMQQSATTQQVSDMCNHEIVGHTCTAMEAMEHGVMEATEWCNIGVSWRSDEVMSLWSWNLIWKITGIFCNWQRRHKEVLECLKRNISMNLWLIEYKWYITFTKNSPLNKPFSMFWLEHCLLWG